MTLQASELAGGFGTKTGSTNERRAGTFLAFLRFCHRSPLTSLFWLGLQRSKDSVTPNQNQLRTERSSGLTATPNRSRREDGGSLIIS
jgi:hypothetical protein